MGRMKKKKNSLRKGLYKFDLAMKKKSLEKHRRKYGIAEARSGSYKNVISAERREENIIPRYALSANVSFGRKEREIKVKGVKTGLYKKDFIPRLHMNVKLEKTLDRKHKTKFRTVYTIEKQRVTDSRNKGIVGRAYDLRNRVQGDTVTPSKAVRAWKPKSTAAKAFRASLVFAGRESQGAVRVIAGAENTVIAAGRGLGGTALREGEALLKGQLFRHANDDASRISLAAATLAFDAVKGAARRGKVKKTLKLNKEKYLLAKSERVYEKALNKPLIRQKKTELKNLRQSRNRLAVSALHRPDKAHSVKLAKRNANIKVVKADIRDMKLRSGGIAVALKPVISRADKISYANVKIEKLQRKMYKASKKELRKINAVSYGVTQLKASAYQKVVTADENNDAVKALDTVKKSTDRVQNAVRKTNAKREKKQDKLKKKKQRAENKLNTSDNKLKKKSSLLDKKAKQTHFTSHGTQSSALKKLGTNIKKQASSAVKSALSAAAPAIFIIIVIFAAVFLLFQGLFSNSSWVIGTYSAEDADLTKALEYYTQRINEINTNILNIKDDKNNWDEYLENLGAVEDEAYFDCPEEDKTKWGRKPKKFEFGAQDEDHHMSGEATAEYDFDKWKLWSYLCARYYDFEDKKEKGEDGFQIQYWVYDGDVEVDIDSLIEQEYQFEYFYQNESRWEELDYYVYYPEDENSFYFNDGCADNRASNDYFELMDEPGGVLSGFSDGQNCLYFDPDTYEILDIREEGDSSESDLYGYNGYKRTGYYLVNQYCDYRNCDRYYYDDWDSYEGYLHDGVPYHGNFKYQYLVSGKDINWSSGESTDTWGWQYFQKEEWIEDCTLYYNIYQKKSFDEIIEDELKALPNGDERYDLYLQFLGDENTYNSRGNHQTFHSPINRTYTYCAEKKGFYLEYGYQMTKWGKKNNSKFTDELHGGLDFKISSGTEIIAPQKGFVIDEYDSDKDLIVLSNDNAYYWYDADGYGKKRKTKIYYYNVALKSDRSVGDVLDEGDVFARSLPETKCMADHEDVIQNGSKVSGPYIHIEIEHKTGLWDWTYIDPALVFN